MEPGNIENDVLSFESAAAFREWLYENHLRPNAIWLRIFKANSGQLTVTYAEALDEALCFGWIDGQKKRYDDGSWLQRFSPRRPKSAWSKVNTLHVERLMQAGRIEPPGQDAVDAAKEDGRWQAAYDSPSRKSFPDDFLQALGRDKDAKAFFESLNQANRYAIAYRLQTAKKPETRQKRMEAILAMLSRGEAFH